MEERRVSYPLAKPRTWPTPQPAEQERWTRRLTATQRSALRFLAEHGPSTRLELGATVPGGLDIALTRLLRDRFITSAEARYTLTDDGRRRAASLERRTP